MNKALDAAAGEVAWSEEALAEQTEAQRLAAQLRAAALTAGPGLGLCEPSEADPAAPEPLAPVASTGQRGAFGFGCQLQQVAGPRPV